MARYKKAARVKGPFSLLNSSSINRSINASIIQISATELDEDEGKIH